MATLTRVGRLADFLLGRPSGLEQRELDVTDIGVAYSVAIAQAESGDDSYATAIPAVYRATTLLTDLVASLSLEQIDKRTNLADEVTPDILESPDPMETYHTTMAKIVASLLFRGNAYLWPRTFPTTTNGPDHFMVLNPDEVNVVWDRDKLFPLYSWRDRKMEAGKDIIHIPLNLWPGAVKGVGPIAAARLLYSGAQSEARLSRILVEDEATPSGLLNVPTKLTPAEAAEVRDGWEASHAQRKRPAVLSGGVTFQPLTIDPVDAQFLESRNFTVQEIARMFGLHGFWLLVSSGDSLNYSTSEGLFRHLVTATLAPTYLERIEQGISRMLPRQKRARFNTDELLRADLGARFAAYAVALDKGFMTVDEVRGLEHLAPLSRSAAPPPATLAPDG